MMILIYILIGITIFLTIIAVLLLVLPINGLYMFLFVHEDWKYWRLFSRNVKNFKYIGHADDEKSYVFAWDDFIAIVWAGGYRIDGYSSVHSKDKEMECVCSTFWKSKSLQFAEKLMKNIDSRHRY